MPAELLLVNPRRKRRSGGKRRKVTSFARNPRRRRKMSAKQRRYFGTRRKSRNTVVMASNPRRRRSRSRRKFTVMRRNPRGLSTGGITGEIMSAGIGAAGGIALDYLFNNYAPQTLNQGDMTSNLARIAGAIGLGMVGGMVAGKKTGSLIAAGALTVTVYDIITNYLSTASGSQGGGGQAGNGQNGQMGRYVGGRIGRIKGRGMRGLGWTSPARVVGFPGGGSRVAGMGRYVGGGLGNLARFQ